MLADSLVIASLVTILSLSLFFFFFQSRVGVGVSFIILLTK